MRENREPEAARELPEFPTEITFKAVYRFSPHIMGTIRNALHEQGLKAAVSSRPSSGGKFVSFTVTAVFDSEERLKAACGVVAAIEGFMTMF
ncbi:MAG TPA: DUF493 family protein [Spirochaetota bacterium]|jgi:putative lipoic acid-binding regulatory protein|nr:DUF493 family protein [Spirochaetota bacterium]OPZ38797.1 MAG: hypothetical protein BWY96_00755 [Spirochaetes bacterium ADurb.BinA120]HNU91972.1 DUF493 family protein [Spirochaetota bacterium]HPI15050.1 DUF493 family protein [Spirochaetota bacterium]HPO46145.1 DUF493 family protein [Spirochaetota bacterium]